MSTPPPENFVMPNFGASDDERESDTSDQVSSGRRKMAFICSKGNLDMAYPALIMGNAARGEGVEVSIFFTFWGLDIINTKTNQNLKFTMAGNTAMHLPELGKIKPGLERLSFPQTLGNLPGMTYAATALMKRQLKQLDVPEIPEFLDLLVASGATLYACQMSFDMMKLTTDDLHQSVSGVIDATEFIVRSEGAQIIFV